MLETNYNEKEINILVTYKEVYIINKETKDVNSVGLVYAKVWADF